MAKKPGTADVKGAAREEAEAAERRQANELYADRPDQSGPFSETKWTTESIDSQSGRPIHQDYRGVWQYSDVKLGKNGVPINPTDQTGIQPNGDWSGMYERDPSKTWNQDTTLNEEWQGVLDSQRGQLQGEIDYRTDKGQQWAANDFSTTGEGRTGSTIGTGDLGQFSSGAPGQTGADDWRQFGTTQQTVGANDYQQFGKTENTIGAGDWQQFGSTNPIMNEGTFDERFGGGENQYRSEFGDHSMDGSQWDTLQYAPAAIRQQAQDDTYNYAKSRLDPQWEKRQADAEVQMRNQGLQPGDQQWESQMEALSTGRSTAYDDARMQSLADSRAEASMLWDQEMGRSEQKNRQTQADVDNIYRGRQSNIENYQSQRGQDMQGYLDYNKNAFGQDLAARQQKLDSNLNYGQEAYTQDLQSRQQQLDADLAFGNEAYSQDYGTRQQQLDANRMYGQQAWEQGFSQNQADIGNYLKYGQEGYNQDFQSRQQQIDAQQEAERINQNRYAQMDPTRTGQGIVDTFGA